MLVRLYFSRREDILDTSLPAAGGEDNAAEHDAEAARRRCTFLEPDNRSCNADGITGTVDLRQVEEIALLNTTLTRPDGARLLYPNIVMATMGVINIARSGPHNESFAVRGAAYNLLGRTRVTRWRCGFRAVPVQSRR